MGKRQRTPHFITGLGDGHVGRENSAAAKGVNNGNGSLQQPTNQRLRKQAQPTKIHSAAATDDIFHVTQHTRRNVNPNNANNKNRYSHLRSATNERLARMDLDDGGGGGGGGKGGGDNTNRWDLNMLLTATDSGSSNDGTNSHSRNSDSNRQQQSAFAMPLHTGEHWQMSAIALIGMLVFLSAIFLHMVSESASSSSSNSGGSSHRHHNHNHSHNSHRRSVVKRGINKRKVSIGTRKKKTDEWSSDEEASEIEDGGAGGTDSDGQQQGGSTAAGTPKRVGGGGGSQQQSTGSNHNNNTIDGGSAAHFYPPSYQPRHRKPSVTGHKETIVGSASFSPSATKATMAVNGFHSRNYYLNPAPGMPSYQSSSSQAANAANNNANNASQQQKSPHPNDSNVSILPGGGGPRLSGASHHLVSPSQPQRPLVTATTAALDNEFAAAGLESFHPRPTALPAVGSTTPLHQQRRTYDQPVMTTPKDNPMDTDEESQSQHHYQSDTSQGHFPASPDPPRHVPYSPVMSPAARAMLYRQPIAQNYSNAAHVQQQQHQPTSFSFDSMHSSNHQFQDSNSSNMLNDSTHHRGNINMPQQQQHQHLSNNLHSGTGMSSPRANVDISELEETPRAGFARRTVVIGDNNNIHHHDSNKQTHQVFSTAQRQSQQPYQHLQSGGSSTASSDDPFRALRLPVVAAMGTGHQGNGDAAPRPFIMPQAVQQQQQQQGAPSIPFIPKLGVAEAVAIAASSGQYSFTGVDPPRSMSVEELHLVQMESGVHWQVQTPAGTSNALTPPTPLGTAAVFAKANMDSPNAEKARYPFVAFAGLGKSGEVFSAASSSSQDFAADSTDAAADAPRNSIVHKRPDMTMSTDAASSLRSSIKFDELKLEDVVGGGGFGQVWKAEWRGTPVAVKVLTGSAQAKHVSKAILEEFAAEINLLSGMRHPNICLYMGACVDPPNRAIITELAANGSLWDALRLPLNPPYTSCDGFSRDAWPVELYNPGKHGFPPSSTGSNLPPAPTVGSWPWGLVKHVAIGAARGMAYLHSGNPPILHRDLKSANILLSESYTAKVCDFGLSRLKAQERSMTGNCGTVQWMAVEVLAQQSYGEKADVYSYGIILIELLTRECPYDGMSAIQCALAVLNRDQRPDIPRWCPPPLRALIKACIKKNPEERPTFGQIIMAIDTMA